MSVAGKVGVKIKERQPYPLIQVQNGKIGVGSEVTNMVLNK